MNNQTLIDRVLIPVEFVIPHYELKGLRFVSVVLADVTDPSLKTEHEFLAYLQRAITAWINETSEGKDAWRESCWDFNIGDLINVYDSDSVLRGFLEREEIFNLRFESFGSGCRNWVHDTLLVNANDLTEEENETKGRSSTLSSTSIPGLIVEFRINSILKTQNCTGCGQEVMPTAICFAAYRRGTDEAVCALCGSTGDLPLDFDQLAAWFDKFIREPAQLYDYWRFSGGSFVATAADGSERVFPLEFIRSLAQTETHL